MKDDNSKIAAEQCEKTARLYYEMRKKGLLANELIEIPAMKKLIGDVSGKKLLDAGCGFGTYSIYCTKNGADVVGVDISKTMIDLAHKEAAEAGVEIDFRIADTTDLEGIPDDTFDVAVSSCTVSFNISGFFREMARVLKPGGILCFSNVHPMFESSRPLREGEDAERIIENYFRSGIMEAKNVFGKLKPEDDDYLWQWEYNTLEDYFAALNEAGFLVEMLLEPKPDPSRKAENSGMYARACNCPIFFLIRAISTAAK